MGDGTPMADLPTVLVVDDYPDAAESLAAVLRQHGYEAGVARSAREALAVEPLPDAVVLEPRLKDADGYALAAALRERAWGIPPAFIAVTTHCRPEDVARSEAAAFAAHLVKPAEPAEVVAVLARVWCPTARAGDDSAGAERAVPEFPRPDVVTQRLFIDP
jgi:CheY-like chemotaxis protein